MVRGTAKQLDPTVTGNEASDLEKDLKRLVIGQDHAVDEIVNIYQTHLAGMNGPGKPIGNFLFLGPTGTGKTRLVEAAAQSLVGDPRAVIKIDCAEFQHSHEIAKLIGSPPGYLGHRETHPLLSQEVLSQYHTEQVKVSFILFDEIEKASDALWNLLLGILDKATLTLGDNRRVDFSRAMIFMTSNLGAAEMTSIVKPGLGFSGGDMERKVVAGNLDAAHSEKISRAALGAARRKFTPEFMNRLDKVVVFHSLGREELERILALEVAEVQERVLNSPRGTIFGFRLTKEARTFLLDEGTDVKYGARHLKRTVDRRLVHPLSNLIASNQVGTGDFVLVDLDEGQERLSFTKEAEAVSPVRLLQLIDNVVAGANTGKAAASAGRRTA